MEREKRINHTAHVYWRVCYFPPGNGEVEVKDNNRRVDECRTQWMRWGGGGGGGMG